MKRLSIVMVMMGILVLAGLLGYIGAQCLTGNGGWFIMAALLFPIVFIPFIGILAIGIVLLSTGLGMRARLKAGNDQTSSQVKTESFMAIPVWLKTKTGIVQFVLTAVSVGSLVSLLTGWAGSLSWVYFSLISSVCTGGTTYLLLTKDKRLRSKLFISLIVFLSTLFAAVTISYIFSGFTTYSNNLI